MDYNSFITVAFTRYGIPAQILQTVRPWVERELGDYGNNFIYHGFDLGYAELADVQTLDQAMGIIKDYCDMWQMEGKRKYDRFLRDAGGREGRGVYRYALKAYYLCQS